MKYKIINEREYKKTQWSGGKTSEIYIYILKILFIRKEISDSE